MGCSLIPKLNFNSGNALPQQTQKSKAKAICKGKTVLNDAGIIVSCERGYYLYEENYNKKERKTTIIEKIKNFVNGLMGWSFWIILALLFLCPSLLGLIGGRLIESVFGITRKSLEATVRGVQKFRKTGKDINDTLSAEQDEKIKKYIRKIKEKKRI